MVLDLFVYVFDIKMHMSSHCNGFSGFSYFSGKFRSNLATLRLYSDPLNRNFYKLLFFISWRDLNPVTLYNWLLKLFPIGWMSKADAAYTTEASTTAVAMATTTEDETEATSSPNTDCRTGTGNALSFLQDNHNETCVHVSTLNRICIAQLPLPQQIITQISSGLKDEFIVSIIVKFKTYRETIKRRPLIALRCNTKPNKYTIFSPG